MTRAISILVALGAVVLALSLSAAGGEDQDGEFFVELDNAFGLIEGGDLKVAGVRAGTIDSMELDRRTNRARIGITIDQDGFGDLRRDVRCESRPQSLIGEYFIDCLPGTSPERLEEGATIPVSQTGSTVAPDLVNAILRRPFRERLSIILGELGAAAAGNGRNLNEALRRASPALRETNRVLKTLADQNQVLASLVTDADRVIGDLADEKEDVGRFVEEAGRTAEVSATRQADIAGGIRRLPAFLEELRPTMAALGRTADAQRPALEDLRASASQLQTFFGRLGPFADASRPAFAALGRASGVGREAASAARPVTALLRRFTTGTPELAKNLRFILEHLDDPEWAVDPEDKRWGTNGLTGLQALLAYVYDQTLSTNVYDSAQHYLKVSVFEGDCALYRDAKAVREDPELERNCGARIGPNAYGINRKDPTARPGDEQAEVARRRAQDRRSPDRQQPRSGADEVPAFSQPPAAGAQPAPDRAPVLPRLPSVTVPQVVPGQPPVAVPQGAPRVDPDLLDYLLGDGR